MLAVTVAAIATCTEKEWRGHVILCCKNGTALKSRRSSNWIWVEKMPLMCGKIESEVTENQISVISIVAIIGATLLSIGCHLYYAIAHCFYRVVREMW